MMVHFLLRALLSLLAGKYLAYLHKLLHFYVTGWPEASYAALKCCFGPVSLPIQQPDFRIQPVLSSLLSRMCACPVRAGSRRDKLGKSCAQAGSAVLSAVENLAYSTQVQIF